MNSNFSILIADDDNDDKMLLRLAFQENKLTHKLHFVDDGAELMNYLGDCVKGKENAQYPSIIMLDLNMPRMDGREALHRIKADNAWKKIPVIIFSTSGVEQDIEFTYKLGANSYITKPSEFLKLVEIVHNLNAFWCDVVTLPSIS
jgi:two-component system response regulator